MLAVILGEPQKNEIVRVTSGSVLAAPGSVPWEVGNAFSSLLKRGRIKMSEAREGLSLFSKLSLRFIEVDLDNALIISGKLKIYAYDAYFLDCASRLGAPLLTVDRSLARSAESMGVKVLEV